MIRVYLDQWVWVGLAKAEAARPDGKQWADALLLAKEGVKNGYVSFPLSTAHYIETSHQRNPEKRAQLAGLMGDISKFHTLAPTKKLLPAEIDGALQAMFGLPKRVRTSRPFGVGVAHAFDWETGNYHVPAEFGLSRSQARVVEEQIQPLFELALLAGPTRETAAKLDGYDPDAHRVAEDTFAKAQEEHRTRLLEEEWHKGDRGRRVAIANAYINFREPLDEAITRAGLHWEQIYELGDPGMSELIGRIPIADADTQLQRYRHESSQKAWEPNDLNDVDFLSRAIAYCDVVATEKQWISVAERAGLHEKYGTRLVAKPGQLAAVLAEAASNS